MLSKDSMWILVTFLEVDRLQKPLHILSVKLDAVGLTLCNPEHTFLGGRRFQAEEGIRLRS